MTDQANKGDTLLPGTKRYYAKKDQLLIKIDRLIREVEQLRQTGRTEHIAAVTNQLEESLWQLSALRQAKPCGNRRTHKKLRGDRN